MGAKQSITPDTHKAHFMGIKAVCVHVCVCVHVLSWVYGKTCQKERASACVSFELLSVLCALCVILCVRCVCRQISKNARWEASPYFQAVDPSKAVQCLSLSSLQEKANPNKHPLTKSNKCYSLLDLSSLTRIPVIKYQLIPTRFCF